MGPTKLSQLPEISSSVKCLFDYNNLQKTSNKNTKYPQKAFRHWFVFNKIQKLFGSTKNIIQLQDRLIPYSTKAINLI
jgi:hypothetical protein